MKELKKLKVSIFGKNYFISTDNDEPDVLRAVKFVDSRMRDLSNKMQGKDGYILAVLVSLELACGVEKCHKDLALFEEKALNLSSLIENEIEAL